MTTKKIAAEFAPGSNKVQLVDKGVVMDRADAVALGYTVSASVPQFAPAPATVAPANGAAIKMQSWRSAIIRSPEATGRDEATAELLTKHSPETLSVEDARAFLRGLPTEQTERKDPDVTKTNADPRAARKVEIANSMTTFNANSGYTARNAARGVDSLSGIDPAKLQRLAELRLNALENGQAHAAEGEGKKLRYALQVHDQTGLPLANVFAQLGVDASKIIR